jgi:23S rRNA (cytosine1962-C5)-methyltransferase
LKIWRLKKGGDRRFRQGHPWVFASELGHSSKECEAGEVVELRDATNRFLAYGYVHPTSQICFRRLSSRTVDLNVLSHEFFVDRLRKAREWRRRAGWHEHSHRWIYAEADGVPGLIVDAFRVRDAGWAVVVQASTIGIERALANVFSALETFAEELGADFALIESPSSRSRVVEGLKIGERRLVRGSNDGLDKLPIVLAGDLSLTVDLWGGQKTGFFLDQQWNASLLRRFLKTRQPEGSALSVLDICCYVGQWGANVARSFPGTVTATLVDSSAAAMQLAEANLRSLGAEVDPKIGDAMQLIGEFDPGRFDIVICDPPAFVKKRADLPSGTTAYVKLLRDAMRAVAPGGILVASSCSGLVGPVEWRDILQQASAKAGRTYRTLVRGGHGPDHPTRPEFPEGEYLKCEIGEIDYPF